MSEKYQNSIWNDNFEKGLFEYSVLGSNPRQDQKDNNICKYKPHDTSQYVNYVALVSMYLGANCVL